MQHNPSVKRNDDCMVYKDADFQHNSLITPAQATMLHNDNDDDNDDDDGDDDDDDGDENGYIFTRMVLSIIPS